VTPSPATAPGSSHVLTLIGDNIVPGIIVTVVGGLILTAILSKRFRSWLWRVVKWPFTIRLTTTERLRAREEKGWHRRQGELDAERAVSIAQPRWSIRKVRSVERPNVFAILNAAEDAVARNVEVLADSEEFVFYDSARFEDLSAGRGTGFDGMVQPGGRLLGVTFRVVWTDGNGDRRQQDVFMSREPARVGGF